MCKHFTVQLEQLEQFCNYRSDIFKTDVTLSQNVETNKQTSKFIFVAIKVFLKEKKNNHLSFISKIMWIAGFKCEEVVLPTPC